MRIKTPNNTNIASYLKPNTVYEAYDIESNYGDSYFSFDNGATINHSFAKLKSCFHLNGQDWIIVNNRQTLRDFVALNNIKTTLVSKQLGKSKGWLTQVMNRTDRGDLSDSELQSIMKQLHVDWTNTQYVNVRATATHAAYRTRPCVYEHAKHKELLQRAFWDGRITK